MHNETWPEYLQRVTDGVPRKDIARAADLDPSGVSRWITGTTARPKAEKVVAFARGLRLNPIEALVAAGYLDPSEVNGVVEIVRTRSELSDGELVDEIAQRLTRSKFSDGAVVAHKGEDLPNWGRGVRSGAASDDSGVRRNKQSS